MNKKEKLHKGRNRVGFHLYLSRFFYEFNSLSITQQHYYLYKHDNIQLGVYAVSNNGDDASIDSTDSVLTRKVTRLIIHRSACKNWKYNMSEKLKRAWCTRATKFNKRKLPGKFLRVPDAIKENNSVEKKVLESLSYEWDTVVKFFENCITR